MPIDIDLPAVPGDPAGMRALAATLRSSAEGIAVVAAQTAGTIDGLEFFGPAATRIDDEVRGMSGRAGGLADELISTAALLERAASEVEAEQAARERELERLRESLVRGGAP